MSQNALVLLPTMPPESRQVRIPESMNPEEEARLVGELGKISTELARVQTRDEERAKFLDQRFRATDARMAKLEAGATASGQYDLALAAKTLDKKEAEFAKWKWWVVTLICSGAAGVLGHLLGM